ncbi:MAG: PEP-CTERM sorting domain-containing protein [Alphaproteobacteria bacterium]|nr:PEP-CTERM sorting domain-containing protein [Alphaproteobacteria bacterium]
MRNILVRASIGAAIVGATFLLGSGASAAVITYNWTGSIKNIGGGGGGLPTLSVGQAITGSFSYDTTASQTSSGSGTGTSTANYTGIDSGSSINFTVGGYTGSANIGDAGLVFDPRFYVTHNTLPSGFDRIRFHAPSVNSTTVGGVAASEFQLQLTDSSNAVFANSAPPLSLDLADFDSTALVSNFDGITISFDNGSQMFASVETLTLDSGGGGPVPEPGALIVFGFGLAGIAAIRRRREA